MEKKELTQQEIRKQLERVYREAGDDRTADAYKILAEHDAATLYALIDSSAFNSTIKGYLILALESAGMDAETVRAALNGLRYSLDDHGAAEAEARYNRYINGD